MSISIWMATWNCENQAPDNAMLNAFIVQEVNNPNLLQKPDLIVIGLQEADINSSLSREFVSQRLAKTKRLGNDYRHIASSYTVGITKGKKNYLQLGVLHNRNSNFTIGARRTGTYRDSLEGKGGVFVEFLCTDNNQLNNQFRLGFINAHLNSKNANKREDEIEGLLKEIAKSNSNANVAQVNQDLSDRLDAVFFMGDLNYRLADKPKIGFDHQTVKVANMSSLIATSQGRSALAALDTLAQSSLIEQYGLTFPPADHLLPTYKRYYQDGGGVNNPCRVVAGQLTNNQPLNQTDIQNCYFNGSNANDLAPYNQRRQAFEIGWLDRIGYKAGFSTERQAAQGLNPNIQPVQVQPPNGQAALQLEAKNSIVLSDHTPVLMKVQVG